MSYAWLIGVVVGVVVVVGMGLIAGLLGRKRLRQECDERTRLIQTQAGATAFYIAAGFTFLAWLFDNAQAYLAGAEPRIISPWSMMLGAMICIYLGANLYHQWRWSMWSNLDAHEKGQVQRRSAVLLGGAAALGGSARLAFERNQAGLGWFLIAFMAVEVAAGFYLFVLSKKRAASE